MKCVLITLILVSCTNFEVKNNEYKKEKRCENVCSRYDRVCRSTTWQQNFCIVD